MSKRVKENLDGGLWVEYGSGYIASVFYTERYDDEPYAISYHSGEMPAFKAERFATLAKLVAAMRELEPDLRKWKLTRYD